MADKGKPKGKGPAPAPAPPPGPAKPEDKKPDEKSQGDKKPGEDAKEEKVKSVQPKDQVGTRKGCRRYRWEFKDSNKEFWFRGHALVKIISMGCLIAALIFFSANTVHPILTLILTVELSIFVFFFVLYTFAIQRYMYFILWPVTDLLNDLCCFVFLIGAIVFGVNMRPTMPRSYLIALILIGISAFFALIDVCLQRSHFKGKKSKKNILVPPPGKDAKPENKPGETPPAAPPAGAPPAQPAGAPPPPPKGKK